MAIFRLYKKCLAESLIGLLLGRAIKPNEMWDWYKKGGRKTTLDHHAKHFRKQAQGGPGGDAYKAFRLCGSKLPRL